MSDLEVKYKITFRDMKTYKIVVEVEVDEDVYKGDHVDALTFVSGSLDNAPAPEEVDESLKGLQIGDVYPE